MNSLCRYLTRITGYLGLLIMIFPGMGIGYDSASKELTSKVNSGQRVDGGGKIIISKLATASTDKKPPEKTRAQQSPSAKKQLLQTQNKRTQQSESTKKQLLHSEPARQPVAEVQSPDITVPIETSLPPPEVEPIMEIHEVQEPIISGPLTPADQTLLLTEIRSQLLNDVTETRSQQLDKDIASPVSKKNDDIQMVSNKLAPEHAPQQDSIQDIVGIIARLLMKFSLITVCCITLFFSFSALKIAKSNQVALGLGKKMAQDEIGNIY